MKATTEELLFLALWTCETLSRAAFRNLPDSFDGARLRVLGNRGGVREFIAPGRAFS